MFNIESSGNGHGHGHLLASQTPSAAGSQPARQQHLPSSPRPALRDPLLPSACGRLRVPPRPSGAGRRGPGAPSGAPAAEGGGGGGAAGRAPRSRRRPGRGQGRTARAPPGGRGLRPGAARPGKGPPREPAFGWAFPAPPPLAGTVMVNTTYRDPLRAAPPAYGSRSSTALPRTSPAETSPGRGGRGRAGDARCRRRGRYSLDEGAGAEAEDAAGRPRPQQQLGHQPPPRVLHHPRGKTHAAAPTRRRRRLPPELPAALGPPRARPAAAQGAARAAPRRAEPSRPGGREGSGVAGSPQPKRGFSFQHPALPVGVPGCPAAERLGF